MSFGFIRLSNIDITTYSNTDQQTYFCGLFYDVFSATRLYSFEVGILNSQYPHCVFLCLGFSFIQLRSLNCSGYNYRYFVMTLAAA